MTHPEITLEYQGRALGGGALGRRRMVYCATWSRDGARYHVWLDTNGKPDDGPETVIHRNKSGSRGSGHLALRGDSKSGVISFAAIAALVADGALDAARAAWEAKQAETRAKADALARRDAQATLDHLWAQGYRPSAT